MTRRRYRVFGLEPTAKSLETTAALMGRSTRFLYPLLSEKPAFLPNLGFALRQIEDKRSCGALRVWRGWECICLFKLYRIAFVSELRVVFYIYGTLLVPSHVRTWRALLSEQDCG